MDIEINENSEQLLYEARKALATALQKNKEHPILLLCSGGSALELLKDIPEECLGPHVTIGVLDERYGHDEAVNNFAQLQKTTLFASAKGAGVQSIDTLPKPNETLEELAQRFEQSLRQWREDHPDGVIVVTMGIGPDGHTSGIMPFPEDELRFLELFNDPKIWVRGYDAGAKNQYPLRVTTTLPFLRLIDYAIVYCVGEGKRTALERVVAEEGTLAETPARIVREMRSVLVFSDISSGV